MVFLRCLPTSRYVHLLCALGRSSLRLIVRYSRPNNLDFFDRTILRARLHESHPLDHFHPAFDSPKDRVFSIEPWRWSQGDEELPEL